MNALGFARGLRTLRGTAQAAVGSAYDAEERHQQGVGSDRAGVRKEIERTRKHAESVVSQATALLAELDREGAEAAERQAAGVRP